jgi:sialate O-acetylesterase
MHLLSRYSSHAVLESGVPFTLEAKECASLPSAFLLNQSTGKKTSPKIAQTSEGSYSLLFEAVEPSFTVYSLTIVCAKESLTLEDLRFGEVFLFAGQSNLSLPLSLVEKREKYQALASSYDISVLNIEDALKQANGEIFRPQEPLKELANGISWQRLSSENAFSFSAIAVMFALLLGKKKRMPIGLILTAVGGISIDSYLSRESVEKNPTIKDYLQKSGKYLAPEAPYNVYGGANYTQMNGIYNEKIAPLEGLPLRAVIWYQGENSAYDFESGRYFKAALEELIQAYRGLFVNPFLPFFVYGLADEFYPYGDGHGLLYIQEALATLSTPSTSYLPLQDLPPRWHNLDEGLVYHPIHTIVKEEAAQRLLQSFLYFEKEGHPFVYPHLEKGEREGHAFHLYLSGEGHFKKGQNFAGFTLAGKERIYYPAKAVVLGEKELLLSAPEVLEPCFARYGMTPYDYLYPCSSLEGWPLVPFRSVLEPSSSSHYLENQPVLSCDFLSLQENNFGYEVGGAGRIALWEKGSILPNKKTRLTLERKDKVEGLASLRVTAEGTHDSYFYFSLQGHLAPSGMDQDFAIFPFLVLSLKADRPTEFHGALFRRNGRIYKLAPFDGTKEVVFVPLENRWQDVALSLRHLYDGSEGSYPNSEEILSSLELLEFYFRGKGKREVHLDNIRRAETYQRKSESETPSTEEKAASLRLPPKKE